MKYPTLVAALGAAMLMAGVTPNAHAAERPLWELGVGVGALRLPHYRGSDQSHNFLLPVPYLVYRGQILPKDEWVTVEAVVTAVDDAAHTLTADGFLSVDGRVIYGMKHFTVRQHPGGRQNP